MSFKRDARHALRRTHCQLLAILGVLALAAPAHAAVSRDFAGLVAEDVFAGDRSYRDAQLGVQSAIGIGLLRQTFDWSAIEQSPGAYQLGAYDTYVAHAARHGITILPILFKPPAFRSSAPAQGARRGTYPPRRYEDLGEFGAVLVRRYGPNGTLWSENPSLAKVPIRAWQIWNEPNLPAYWPTGPNPKQYTRLLAAASKRIKAADPGAEIVTAGMPKSRLGMGLTKYVDGLYAAGGKRWFDTLALNPYARSGKELLARLKDARRQMNRHRDRSARIWVTELGWADSGPPSPFRMGANRQAKLILDAFRRLGGARSKLRLRGVVYYAWRDGQPYAPNFTDFWGLHTGVLDISGQPKPAFSALQQAVAGLR